jgi:YgiT-type zinc finger domain-containing protein
MQDTATRNNIMNEPTDQAFPCNECQAGIMHLQYITFFTWLGEELVTVPAFPAWICDVCGRREYAEHAVHWLSALLSPDAGRSTGQRAKLPTRPHKRTTTRPSPPE